jgi:2-dehydro-3-deoxy-D-arabinonate dehydratase
VTPALFRLRLGSGEGRLARGTIESGPLDLLPVSMTLDRLLAEGADAVLRAATEPAAEPLPVPAEASIQAPVESQEVWAAGVTYERSRDARMEESEAAASVYDRVYDAERPELFFKAAGWRTRGPAEIIARRADSSWDVPEPELALVLDRAGTIAAYTIGNDVSSRSIEGENPLYIPQAKVYDHACALGPALVPASAVGLPLEIEMTIERAGDLVFAGHASTAQMHRSPEELAAYLHSALTFPVGAVLLTGTTIVPAPPFTLTRGDIVRIAIPPLGELLNPVEVVGNRKSIRSTARRMSAW